MATLSGEQLREFGGLRVVDWPQLVDETKQRKERSRADAAAEAAVEAGAGEVAWRIAVECYDAKETWPEAFARFASAVDLGAVKALVVGSWPEAYDSGSGAIVETLVAARDRLTSLRAVFIGDMTSEECEISWIHQSDVTLLLSAFPELEVLGIRGASSLAFPPVRHERLQRLFFESGGLPAEVVRGVAGSDFPALTSLELWLGTPEYGGDCEIRDLADILTGVRLPALRQLALCNSEIEDEVAAACASAPVVAGLEELDLSMGVLTDEGAEALLGGQPLTHLKTLDLSYNYLGEDVAGRLREALEPAGVTVELDDDDADEYTDDDGTVERFVAVGE